MISLTTTSIAQEKIANHIRDLRLNKGLTQEGLANRSGVSLPTLRKFEQKGLISLESFLKIVMVFDRLDNVIQALEPSQKEFSSIDEVIKNTKTKSRQRGRHK
ncbi:MAG: helix-turn-helix transcriptional regulator [Cyclobacteriaceae bacterium]